MNTRKQEKTRRVPATRRNDDPGAGTVARRARHRRFAELIASGERAGAAYKSAFPDCKTDGAASASAGRLLRKPEVGTMISELQRDAAERNAHRLFALQEKAIQRLEAALDGKATEVQMKAARDVLDRTGLTSRFAVEVGGLPGHGRSWEDVAADLPR